MNRLHKVAVGVAALIGGVGIVALGPSLIRTDSVRYRFAGVIGDDILEGPIGIAYAAGRLYVSDAVRNRVVVFDTAGAMLALWGDMVPAFGRPMHLSMDRNGLLHVAEYLNDRVSVLDSSGALVKWVGGVGGTGPGELDAPGGVAVLDGRVFVADFYNHRVGVFGPGGTGQLGRPGRVFAARMHYPTDVAVDDSLVYVADAYNHRIQVFRPDGQYVRRWGGLLGFGGRGSLKGWFKVAIGLAVAVGQVYVADFYNDRVQIFTDRGRFLGVVRDSLSLPTDVAVTADGSLYVVDFGHHRVVRFRRD